MYKTLERSDYVESKQTDPVTLFLRNRAPGPAAVESFPVRLTLPRYRRSYEILKTDNVWKKNYQKDCQHYKVAFDQADSKIGLPLNCLHYSEIGHYDSLTGTAPLLGVWNDSLSNVFGQFGEHTNGFETLIQEDTGDGFVPRPANLEELTNASYKALLPAIKADLSLVNSIIELKDFRSLPGTIRSLASFGAQIGNRFLKRNPAKASKWMRSLRGSFSRETPTMSEALGTGANGYLLSEFAIRPLLSDISSIYAAMSRTYKSINDLISRQGKRQYKYFTVHVPTLQQSSELAVPQFGYVGRFGPGFFYVPEGTQTAVYPYCWQDYQCIRELIPATFATFHAQIEYNFHFTRFQLEHAQVYGHLDALGINLNPAIIWNAIPWSFLVDWLIGVSRWLDDRKQMLMEPVINITRYSWSYEYSRRIRVRVKAKSPAVVGVQLPWVYLPDLVESTYRRTNEMPVKTSLMAVSGLSSKELSLGVALAITRVKRFKPRRVFNPALLRETGG